MNDFTKAETVYFFQFIDNDKIGALELEDILICDELAKNLSIYELNNCLIAKSKNELIDKMICYLQGLKDE